MTRGISHRSCQSGPSRGVRVILNAEALAVRTYPLEQGHVTIAELHY
jgi:hypothetical protein